MSNSDLAELEDINKENPYFQSGHIIVARASKLLKNKSAGRRINTAATYSTNRTVLKDYMQGNIVLEKKAPPVKIVPKTLIKSEPKEEITPVTQEKVKAPVTPRKAPESLSKSDHDLLIDDIYANLEKWKKSRDHYLEFEKASDELELSTHDENLEDAVEKIKNQIAEEVTAEDKIVSDQIEKIEASQIKDEIDSSVKEDIEDNEQTNTPEDVTDSKEKLISNAIKEEENVEETPTVESENIKKVEENENQSKDHEKESGVDDIQDGFGIKKLSGKEFLEYKKQFIDKIETTNVSAPSKLESESEEAKPLEKNKPTVEKGKIEINEGSIQEEESIEIKEEEPIQEAEKVEVKEKSNQQDETLEVEETFQQEIESIDETEVAQEVTILDIDLSDNQATTQLIDDEVSKSISIDDIERESSLDEKIDTIKKEKEALKLEPRVNKAGKKFRLSILNRPSNKVKKTIFTKKKTSTPSKEEPVVKTKTAVKAKASPKKPAESEKITAKKKTVKSEKPTVAKDKTVKKPTLTKKFKIKTSLSTKIGKKSDSKTKPVKSEKTEIIDAFLKENPSIKANKKTLEFEPKDLTGEIENFPEDIATENLTLILEKQGKFDMAISVYTKLIAKFPEKEKEFQKQIDRIKSENTSKTQGDSVKEEALLFKFMTENPTILVSNWKELEEIVEEFTKDITSVAPELISESMADILIYQKNIDKAILIYERLILINPEKKSHFSSQIKKITKK